MAKLILKSIAYYPQALAELPMSHKDLGLIDTDKPYKKLIIPTQNRHLYRLVDQQTGQVLKAQKLIRDHNDLKVYVGDVIVVELKDFFSFQNAITVKAEEEPLYMVDAGEVSCISGLISPSEGINLPEMYVLWEPGMPVASCLNPQAMAVMPIAGLAGISGLTIGGALAMTATVGASIVQSNLSYATPPVVLPKLIGAVFAGPVIGQTPVGGNIKVSGLKVQAFDAKGNSLGVTDVKADGTYELELTNPTYKGALVLKVFDPAGGVTAQYMNEATRTAKSFPTLMAVINYQGDATKPVSVNITTLTNLAAVKAGATLSGDSVTVPAIKAIEDANTLVANKYLGNNSLLDSPVTATVNADGTRNLDKANTYGIALELLSQIESVSSKNTDEVATLLSSALSSPATNQTIISYMNQASVYAIQSGVDASNVKAMVSALGNQLATGTVSLSSNASPAINLSTIAPDENSILTAAVRDFVDANNSNKADKTFSNPVTYQWQSSNNGVNWSNIGDNAKTSGFILTQAQVGQQVRVLVKSTDDSGFDEYLASAATKAVHNVNQLPAGSISIGVNNSGALQQNNILGIISNSLTDTDGLGKLSYQWQSRSNGGNFIDIPSATFDTYTLTQTEVGKEVRLKVSYIDGQGTAEQAFSVQTSSVANVNDPPQGNVLVNGQNTPHVAYTQGDVLTATNTLSDPDNNGAAISGLTYQWQTSSDGNYWIDIKNATADTYTLTQADVKKYVQVLAKYTDATNVNESKASESSSQIGDVNDAPTGTITVSGTPTENQTLTAAAQLSDADNNGADISGMTYQWEQADTASGPWQAIASATDTTFTLGNAQVNKLLRVTVSYTDAGGYINSQSSTATAAIVNVNDRHTGTVNVSGSNNNAADYTQKSVLKATNDLNDADGMSRVSYQWQNSANGTDWIDINSATTDSYTLTQSDVGKYVHVRASYTDLHGTTETEDSSTAARVANVNDTPTGSVTITGHLKQGTVLQAANTLDDLDGMGVVSYQWQVSSDNSDWKDMVGATGSSFTLTQAQTGKYVRVKASYTDGLGQAETVYNDISSNTTVLDVMEAPVLRVTPANQMFTEASGLNQQANEKGGFFSNAQLSDAENNNITSMQFSVSGLKDGTDEKLFINGTAVTLTASQSGAELVSGVGLSVVMSGLDNSVATVTLSNTNGWTLADAHSLIASVAYQNTNTDKPTPGDRSIALLELVDNGVKANPDDSNTANFLATNNTALIAKVTVQAVNDAPVVNGQSPATPVFNENGSAVTVNTAISISDVDTALMKSAIIKINSGYVSGDSLSVNLSGLDTGDISVTAFNAATQQLVLNSTNGASLSQWENALRAVQFVSTSHNPGSSRSIDFVVNDGSDNSLVLTTTVSVTPVNDAPVLSNASTTPAYTENNTTVIQPGITVSDADNAVPVKVTVAFINNSFVSAEDQLLFTSSASTGNIAAAWDAGAGTLTLTSLNNSATLSQWNAAMQAVSYKNQSDTPNTSNRSISVVSNDGTDDSVAAVTTVSVTAVNDAPVLVLTPNNQTFTEGSGSAQGADVTGIFTTATFTDVESNNIASITLTVSNVLDSGNELLLVDGKTIALGSTVATTALDSSKGLSYTQTWDSDNKLATIVLSKAGGVALSDAKTVLESIGYRNTNIDNPTTGTRAVSVTQITDTGSGTSPNINTTNYNFSANVNVTALNDAPVLTLTANDKTFTEGTGLNLAGTAVNNIFTAATFTDAESNNIASITLTVSNVLDGSNEVLLVDGKTIALGSTVATTDLGSSNGLSYTQTWDSGSKLATIVLSKAGGVALGNAKTILESIGYQNTNTDNPTAGERVLSVTQITDIGLNTGANSNISNYSRFIANITVQTLNDLPVNTVPASVSVGYNSSTYITGLGVSDADAEAATTFSVKLTVNQGTLNLSNLSGVRITGNSTNSVTLTGKVADIQTLLTTANAVQYTAPTDTGGSFTLTMTSNDAGNSGSGAGTDVVSTVSITVNQLPVLSTPANKIAIATEDTEIEITADMLRTNTSATDAEDSPVNAFVVKSIASGTTVRIGTSSGSATDWIESTNAVLDGTRKLYWKAAQNANGTGLSAFTVAAKDSVGGESLNVVPITLDVTAVNDAPKFSNSPAAAPVSTPMNTNYVLPTGYSVDDVDAGSSAMLKLSFTLKEGAYASGSLAYALGGSGVTWVSTTGNVYTFQGTLSQLNTWMGTANFLTYTPTTGFMGAATIAMAIDDQGNSGGSALTTNATLTINVKDVTPPLLQSVSTNIDGSKIILTYNEALASTTAAPANFRYLLNGTGSYTPNSVTVNGSTIELNLIANKPVFGDTFSVNYTAPVTPDSTTANAAVQDTTGNDAVAIANNNGLTATNSVTNIAPTLSTTPVTNAIPETWFTVNGLTNKVTAANVVGRNVELTLAPVVDTTSPITLAYTNTNTSKAIQDTTGNDAANSAISIPVEGTYIPPVDTVAPALVKAIVNSTGTKVILTYNETMAVTTAALGAFTVTVGVATRTVSSVSVVGGNVELTLSGSAVTSGQAVTVTYTDPTGGNDINAVQDSAGNDAAAISNTFTVTNTVGATDTTAPVFRSALTSADGSKIILTYDEALSSTTAAKTAFAISIAGGTAVNPSSVSMLGNTVVLNLASPVNIGQAVRVGYNAPASSSLASNAAVQDTTGNDAAAISTPINVTNNVADFLAPTLISATLNATRDKVLLTYSESLYTTTAPDRTKFTVTFGANASSLSSVIISTAAINATDPNTVELTLQSAIAANLPFVTVSYTNTTDHSLANTTSVQDPTGNDAASFSKLLVPTTNIDSVLPVLRTVAVSSSVGGNKLIMTYSEALNNASNFTEGSGSAVQGTAVFVFKTASISAGEAAQNITRLSFTVSGLKDGTDEKITVDGTTFSLTNGTGNTSNAVGYNAMSYAVTVSDSTATVTLTKAAGITAAQAQSLLTGITYQNTNIDNPTPGMRVFDIASITDSSGAENATASFEAGTNSSSVLVTALNDGPTFSTNTPPSSLTTTNSQAPDKALSILSNATYRIRDVDGGNTIERVNFSIQDVAGTNILAPLNFNFPNKPTSLYLSKTSGNTYTVFGTVADLNDWLALPNAVTYNPRTGFIGSTTTPPSFKITDTFGGLQYSNSFQIAVTKDTTAPSFKTAVVSSEANNKIILSYDEPLNTSSGYLPLASAFTVTGTSVSSVSVVGTNVILTTSGAIASGATVTYNKPESGTAAIQDAGPNGGGGDVAVVGGNNQAVTTTSATINTDTIAPVLASSPVFFNGEWGISKFLIYFNEELASSVNVANFSFSVVDPLFPDRTGGGSLIGQYGGSTSVSGASEKAVALSFNVMNISPSASLQVTYTDPSTANDTTAGVVQDLAGNDAPNMVLGAWTNDILTAASFAAGRSVLVVGGQGNDTMTGGSANDTFTWFAGDAGATGAVDVVKSFVPVVSGVGDKLDISKLLTNSYFSGTSTLSQWVTSVTNNASGAPTGVSATNTKIVIDVDGQPAVGAAAGAAGTGTVTQTIWLDGVNLTLSGDTLEAQLTALKASGVLIA